MGTITHKAGRIAVSKVTDVVLKNLDKDREKEILKLVDFIEKYMDGEKLDVDFNNIRKKIEPVIAQSTARARCDVKSLQPLFIKHTQEREAGRGRKRERNEN